MRVDEFRGMLDAMASSWTARDYEAVASCFQADLFYSDALNYEYHTHEKLLEFFREDGGFEQYCRFHNAVFDEERQLGVAEYTYRGHQTYFGTVWIEIVDEKIKTWREYQYITQVARNEFWKGHSSD